MLECLRLALCVTLPILGVMVVMHPASVAAMCVLKKFALLEGKLWNKWCPEAYIIFISISCIIFIANRPVHQAQLPVTGPSNDLHTLVVVEANDSLQRERGGRERERERER